MTQAEIMDVLRQGLWAALLTSLPILSVALAAGLAIGLLQALTSIQELTLTFVPKMAASFAAYWMSMGFMSDVMIDFWRDRIIPAIAGG